jgi:hypothetical protein
VREASENSAHFTLVPRYSRWVERPTEFIPDSVPAALAERRPGHWTDRETDREIAGFGVPFTLKWPEP